MVKMIVNIGNNIVYIILYYHTNQNKFFFFFLCGSTMRLDYVMIYFSSLLRFIYYVEYLKMYSTLKS